MKGTWWRKALFPMAALLMLMALSACSGTAAVSATDDMATEPVVTEALDTTDVTTVATEAPVTPDLTTVPGGGPGMGQGVGPMGTPGQGMGQGHGHGPMSTPGQGMGQGHGHGPMGTAGQGMGQGHGPMGTPGQGVGGPPPGWGPENPWRVFHTQPIPAEFANLTNPVPADEASIARGQEIYQIQCASCHGESGLGEAEAGLSLEPPAAPVARTAQRMSDAYLYWRIHEGGAAFGTAMPAYGAVLSEEQIWDVINYLRALGNQTASTGVQQQAMLQQAVEQGVLTQDEADLFAWLHAVVEAYKDAHWDELRAQAAGDPDAMLELMLQGLVEEGTLTPEEADAFRDIHQRLHDAGLMP